MPAQAQPARGDTILDIFGSWLFNAACKVAGNGFERGRAEALGALARIASRRGGHPTEKYLPQIYHCLLGGLDMGKEKINVRSVLVNSRLLFSNQLPGSEMLVSGFLDKIEEIFEVCLLDFLLLFVQSVLFALLFFLSPAENALPSSCTRIPCAGLCV